MQTRLQILLAFSLFFLSCDYQLDYDDIQGNWQAVKCYSDATDDTQYFMNRAASRFMGHRFILNPDGTARFGRNAQHNGEWDFEANNKILSLEHDDGENFGQLRVIARGDSTLKIALRIPDAGEVYLILLDRGEILSDEEYEVY